MDSEEFEQRVHDSQALAAVWRAIGFLREQQVTVTQPMIMQSHADVNKFVDLRWNY